MLDSLLYRRSSGRTWGFAESGGIVLCDRVGAAFDSRRKCRLAELAQLDAQTAQHRRRAGWSNRAKPRLDCYRGRGQSDIHFRCWPRAHVDAMRFPLFRIAGWLFGGTRSFRGKCRKLIRRWRIMDGIRVCERPRPQLIAPVHREFLRQFLKRKLAADGTSILVDDL